MGPTTTNAIPTVEPTGRWGALKYLKNNLSRAHAIVFVVLFIVFTLLTYRITNAGLDDGPEHNYRVYLTTLGTIAGPLTGAISRGFQGCCLRFSLLVMAYCAPVLLVSAGLQFIRTPDWRWLRVAKLVFWTLGWVVWFGGGILSFGHALS
ncbi:MAG: hypothetical protein AMXMBFR82_03340 [Candidatus Hydrogenedentota bacterium]